MFKSKCSANWVALAIAFMGCTLWIAHQDARAQSQNSRVYFIAEVLNDGVYYRQLMSLQPDGSIREYELGPGSHAGVAGGMLVTLTHETRGRYSLIARDYESGAVLKQISVPLSQGEPQAWRVRLSKIALSRDFDRATFVAIRSEPSRLFVLVECSFSNEQCEEFALPPGFSKIGVRMSVFDGSVIACATDQPGRIGVLQEGQLLEFSEALEEVLAARAASDFDCAGFSKGFVQLSTSGRIALVTPPASVKYIDLATHFQSRYSGDAQWLNPQVRVIGGVEVLYVAQRKYYSNRYRRISGIVALDLSNGEFLNKWLLPDGDFSDYAVTEDGDFLLVDEGSHTISRMAAESLIVTPLAELDEDQIRRITLINPP